MATEKQKMAVDRIVENRGNISKSMREAGYDDTTAKNPKNLTESKGYKELCEEYGLTDELIITSLVADIIAKPQNRKPELELGAKMKGLMIEKKEIDHTSKGEALHPVLVKFIDGNTTNN
jgi:hypothetical protein